MNIKTPNQIEQIIADNQYKYLELISRSKKYGGYNATPKDLKNKINQVKKFLENLPDDLYILNFKISPRGDVFPYEYIKGTPNLTENAVQQPAQIIPIYQNNLEKFQTLEEWKKQEKLINDLQKELELLKFKNSLQETLSEKEPEKNVFLGFAETILPNVLPVIDKYFDLKEKELSIKEKLNELKTPKMLKKIVKKEVINVPNIEDPGFEDYCLMFESLSDNEANNIMNNLKNTNVSAYNELLKRYYES